MSTVQVCKETLNDAPECYKNSDIVIDAMYENIQDSKQIESYNIKALE